MREETPILEGVHGANGVFFWLITRYEEARTALADPRLSRDLSPVADVLRSAGLMPPDDPQTGPRGHDMLDSDPPAHTRLRRAVSKAFTPRRIENLRPVIQTIADELLDLIAPFGEADLMSALAQPLPFTVLTELLGVPDSERERLLGWTAAPRARSGTPEYVEARRTASWALGRYLDDLVVRRRSARAQDDIDTTPRDLIGVLLASSDEPAGLSDVEIVATLRLLITASYLTTRGLIGNGALALLTHPDQWTLLKERPELVPSAIEEILRYDTSFEHSFPRLATDDVEIGGTVIPRGSVVQIVLASANRDPRRFDDPDDFDVTRGDNQHLAFGHDIHFCLGAPLARLEAQTAIATLLRRFPDLAMACRSDELEWRPRTMSPLRALVKLPVRFTPPGSSGGRLRPSS